MSARPTFLLLLAVLLAGCAETAPPPVAKNNAERHPILVIRDGVQFTLEAPFAPDALRPEQTGQLRHFVRDYLDRGRDMVVLELMGPPGTDPRWTDYARQILQRQGLPAGNLAVLSGITPADAPPRVRMRFAASGVEVPECGDWSSPSAARRYNLPHADFGCSLQRNLGLMVANPDDLITARPATSPDADHLYRVITTYRSGEDGGGTTTEATTTSE